MLLIASALIVLAMGSLNSKNTDGNAAYTFNIRGMTNGSEKYLGVMSMNLSVLFLKQNER